MAISDVPMSAESPSFRPWQCCKNWRKKKNRIRLPGKARRATIEFQKSHLRTFPQPVLEDCYRAANAIYAELSETKPHFKNLCESLVPYRSNAYAWWQVAQLGFDTFQVRMP